mgnify:FL=1|tara:strand:+ start:336 stop:2048 length:1713 start_codon:yes stop_codon:yes gene_type:complete
MLDNYSNNNSNNNSITQDINNLIDVIKNFIENHEQKQNKLSTLIDIFIKKQTSNLMNIDKHILVFILNSMNREISQPENVRQWENPLGRRFESQIQIEISQNPTDMMMSSLKNVSDKMIEILDDEPNIREHFLYMLHNKAHVIAFGSMSEIPAYELVKEILLRNSKDDFITIMHMHFKFARDAIYILSEKYTDLKQMNRLFDNKVFGSDYYKDRGRAGDLKINYTNRMGILTNDTDFYNDKIPKHFSWWVSDSKSQAPNFSSPYTQSLINNEVPYVAGPSGMTSRFISQMLAFNILTKTEKQSYVLSVSAYMVSSGFHSLHEVLGPIAYCLPEEDLIPGYNSIIESKDSDKKTPNFSAFYLLFETLDPEFKKIKKEGWGKLNEFIKNIYLSHAVNLFTYENLCGDFKPQINKGINSYQQREIKFFSFLTDKTKDEKRAQNYSIMFSHVETKLQFLIILYTLLSSDGESLFNKYIYTNMNFQNINSAKKYISELIEIKLKETITDTDNLSTKTNFEEKLEIIHKNIIPEIIGRSLALLPTNNSNDIDLSDLFSQIEFYSKDTVVKLKNKNI